MRVHPFMKRRILAVRPKSQPDFRLEKNARLTVVIPYRDREEHLTQLIPVLKRTLDEQVPDYRILVVEQAPGKLFNRGKISNIGAHFAMSESDYFCLHDIDMLPVKADYRCPSAPLRLIKKFERTWRPTDTLGGIFFGGVLSLSKKDFLAVNGYSNDFWGWGKEDDDLFDRMILRGLVPYEDNEGLFRELPNPPNQRAYNAPINRVKRSELLRGLKSMDEDGFGNLTYKILAEKNAEGYYQITVDI
jgi:hypothetical protein